MQAIRSFAANAPNASEICFTAALLLGTLSFLASTTRLSRRVCAISRDVRASPLRPAAKAPRAARRKSAGDASGDKGGVGKVATAPEVPPDCTAGALGRSTAGGRGRAGRVSGIGVNATGAEGAAAGGAKVTAADGGTIGGAIGGAAPGGGNGTWLIAFGSDSGGIDGGTAAPGGVAWPGNSGAIGVGKGGAAGDLGASSDPP